jgi:hypothetical protein
MVIGKGQGAAPTLFDLIAKGYMVYSATEFHFNSNTLKPCFAVFDCHLDTPRNFFFDSVPLSFGYSMFAVRLR